MNLFFAMLLFLQRFGWFCHVHAFCSVLFSVENWHIYFLKVFTPEVSGEILSTKMFVLTRNVKQRMSLSIRTAFWKCGHFQNISDYEYLSFIFNFSKLWSLFIAPIYKWKTDISSKRIGNLTISGQVTYNHLKYLGKRHFLFLNANVNEDIRFSWKYPGHLKSCIVQYC